MNYRKRVLPIALTVCMILSMNSAAFTAYATDDPVSYIDADGVEQQQDEYTVITDGSTALGTGWYVVADTVSVSKRMTVSGDVNLILCDGAALTAAEGVTVNSGNSLTIFAQSGGSGSLETGTPSNQYAGIGGYRSASGLITINGGMITVKGGSNSAGIGGGDRTGGTTVINGGTVTATGGSNGAGIGGADGYNGGSITINGGTVTATGGDKSAGIGGGGYWSSTGTGGGAGNIVINGGTVVANAGTKGGAGSGIGAAYNATAGSVSLSWTALDDSITADSVVAETVTLEKDFRLEPNGSVLGTAADLSSSFSLVPYEGTAVTVTFDSDGGSEIPSQRYVYGASAVRPADPERAGYVFSGWVLGSDTYDFSSELTDNITLRAVWMDLSQLSYIDSEGTEQTLNEYIPVSDGISAMSEGWYAVSGDIQTSNRVVVSGSVNLILCDDSALTASKGISVNNGSSLTVYAQSGGSGVLETSVPDAGNAGIGGDSNLSSGQITVYGGNITAFGGNYAAGIGGGRTKEGFVSVFGGTVNATGGANGYGAGIGSGYSANKASMITIGGGSVTASGGAHSAGIGGGDTTRGGVISINGGVTSATGGFCGIGGVETSESYDNSITMDWSAGSFAGMRVTASSYSATEITFNRSFILPDGRTIADAENAAGKTIMPFDGTIHTVTFYDEDGTTVLHTVMLTGGTVSAPDAPVKPGHTFVAWKNGDAVFDFSAPVNSDLDLTAYYEQMAEVSYIDADGTEKSVQDYYVITSDSSALSGGWYVVNADTEIAVRAAVSGTVNLILADGAALTAAKGITVNESDTLNIFGQSEGTGSIVTGKPDSGMAGLGGSSQNNGTVNIYGGTVSAVGGDNAAGIGGGNNGNGGRITIAGGSVTAAGGNTGAGIGGGNGKTGGTVTITGGVVNASGGSEGGSGIGGGYRGAAGTVSISGGTVTANGGGSEGSGIGAGAGNSAGSITISGGIITANGGSSGYGIGAGASDSAMPVSISWTDPSDKIYAQSYTCAVTVPEGKYFVLADAPLTLAKWTGASNVSAKNLVPYEGVVYTVNFMDQEELYASEKVAAGGAVDAPDEPEGDNILTFDCWQLNGSDYDLSAAVTGDTTLTASWKLRANIRSYTLENAGTSAVIYRDLDTESITSGSGVSADSPIYVVQYDESGRFITAAIVSASETVVEADNNAASIQIIWSDSLLVPLCEALLFSVGIE